MDSGASCNELSELAQNPGALPKCARARKSVDHERAGLETPAGARGYRKLPEAIVVAVLAAYACVGCGQSDRCTEGVAWSTSGTVTRGGTTITIASESRVPTDYRAALPSQLHEAVDDASDVSGDILWGISSQDVSGSFAVALRLPVSEGTSIPLAFAPLSIGPDFQSAGSLTGTTGATTTHLESGTLTAAVSGNIEILAVSPLAVHIRCDYTISPSSETVALDAEVHFEPREVLDQNCN